MREAELCRREGITVNVFLLSGWSQSREDIQFAYRLAEAARGRVFFTAGRDLDRFVVWDYRRPPPLDHWLRFAARRCPSGAAAPVPLPAFPHQHGDGHRRRGGRRRGQRPKRNDAPRRDRLPIPG